MIYRFDDQSVLGESIRVKHMGLSLDDAEIVAKAKTVAWAMGITLYVRDGRMHQYPPGIEIDPGPMSRPLPMGSGAPPSSGVAEL